MKKEEFIKLGISEELAAKAEEASENELKGFVPKSRFNEVNEELKTAKETIVERDKQIGDLKKVDAENLERQIEELQESNRKKDEEHQNELKATKMNNALELALATAKAKNIATVKPLLKDFMDNAELDGDKVKGLDDAVQKIKEAEDTKFLFEGTAQIVKKATEPQNGSDPEGGGSSLSFAEAIASAINKQLGKDE